MDELQKKIDDLRAACETDSSKVRELLAALQERTERDSPRWLEENEFVSNGYISSHWQGVEKKNMSVCEGDKWELRESTATRHAP